MAAQRIPTLILLALSASARLASAELGPAAGLDVPEGFEVSLYADDDLAHDIHCLTFDAMGRVVVSGPGYIKILADKDGDGRADAAALFAEPRTGAQGMYFHGRDLLCTTEGGLVRFRDRNGDDRADGPPDIFLRIKTGGEHDAHAIRHGPDGWWYLIAGNSSGVGASYISTETSPIVQPRAGVLLRLAPDLSSGEVAACGFRNPYDFTFDALGEIFTADSDGERDVSLPWYLPSRLVHVLPGSDAGWVTESWKRQPEFLDLPPTVASLGRSSPTGVICYRHSQFPPEFQSALFVLDWTYGRVQVVSLRQEGSSLTAQPETFLSGVGAHGFAPTSGAVGPDGALYISVGGRGTRGGVYRITSFQRPAVNFLTRPAPATLGEKLVLCLRCPDPLSSWARRVWEPLVKELGSEPFIQVAQDEQRPAMERIRAIEILTEKFNGLDAELQATLAASERPAVRARTAWSIGRTQTQHPRASVIATLLADNEPFVVRTALEACLGAAPETLAELIAPIAQAMASTDPYVRQAAVHLAVRANEDAYQAIAAEAAPTGWQAGAALAAAYAARHDGVDPYTIDVALRILENSHPVELKRQAARLLQLALGDCGPAHDAAGRRDAVFDAYAPSAELSASPDVVAALRERLPALYPAGDALLDRELARVLAMVQPEDPALLDKVLSPITDSSSPVDDLHQLIVAARLPAARSPEQRARIADGLIGLEPKMRRLDLAQDLHWNERVMELYSALVELDSELPVTLLQHEGFGEPGHAQFLVKLHPSHFETAVNVFAKAALEGGANYDWNTDVAVLLSQSPDPRVRTLVRAKFDDFGLRPAVLLTLAEDPQESDRSLFISGLGAAQFDVLGACVRALSLLPASRAAEENVALLRTLRRLGSSGQEAMIRDQVVEALRRNTGLRDSYELGRPGEPQAEAVADWTQKIRQAYPIEFAAQAGENAQELATLQQQLTEAPWDSGDRRRGEQLFKQRACVQCHGNGRALGPDLHGVTARFSRADLFVAIASPNQDVSPRYQAETIVTREGQSLTGLVVYEAVDGLVLRDAANRTCRIEASDIETRRKSSTSLMPAGLLKDMAPRDLADLYAYLEGLSSDAGEATAAREAAVE